MSIMGQCAREAARLPQLRLRGCSLEQVLIVLSFQRSCLFCSFRAMGLMLGLVVIGSIVTLLDVLLYPFLLCFDKRWVVPHRCANISLLRVE